MSNFFIIFAVLDRYIVIYILPGGNQDTGAEVGFYVLNKTEKSNKNNKNNKLIEEQSCPRY